MESPPNALSPVSTISVPPSAELQAMPETTCVGRLSPIELHDVPRSVDIQIPPLEAAAKMWSPAGSAANDVTRPARSARPWRVDPFVVSYSLRSPTSGVVPYGDHV